MLCGGIPNFLNPSDGTQGKLIRIDPTTNAIEASFTFASHIEHPTNLIINKAKDKLLYLENFSSGKIFSFDITASSLSTIALANRSYYSISVDPTNDQLFTSVTNYSNGWILRYTANAALIDSFQVGVIPGNFYFN